MNAIIKFIEKIAPFFASMGWVQKIVLPQNCGMGDAGKSKKKSFQTLPKTKAQKSAFMRRGVRNH